MDHENGGPARRLETTGITVTEDTRLRPYDSDAGAQLDRPAPAGDGAAARTDTGAPAAGTRSTGNSACLIMAATFAVLALSCMLLAFATFQSGLAGLNKLTGLVPSLGINLVTTPTVSIDTSRPTVVERVRSLSKLETVHYDLEKVISAKSSGPLFDFLTGDKILLVAHGEVVAGVDLGKLAPQDIRIEGDRVTIKLPGPEILYSKLDNDKTYVYDRQTGLFSKPDPGLESRLRVAAEEQIVLAAKEDGILSKAQENAKQTVRTLVEGMGYGEVQFEEAP